MNSVRQVFKRWKSYLPVSRSSRRVHAPLLTDVEIQELTELARQATRNPLHSQHEVKHPLLGERMSVYAGSGYEFAENRHFVNGDDIRFINWRLMARTGQMYKKVFYEERKPQVWIIMDRRSSMRFGTRRQLKVCLAARLAIYHLYQAVFNQLQCGMILMDDDLDWHAPVQHQRQVQPYVQNLIAACPPIHTATQDISLNLLLRQLQTQLIDGSIVFLISDFHDLDTDAAVYLHTLAHKHTLHALHVIDQSEVKFDPAGQFSITNDEATLDVVLDLNQNTELKRINQQLQEHQQRIRQIIRNTGIDYQVHDTATSMTSITHLQEDHA